MKKKFAILDGNNLLFRAYYALPLLANFDGEYSNGVFGFTNMLVHIIQDIKPDYIAVCFDKGKTFRHEMYDEYKAQRSPAPQELLSQFPIMERMLDAMNIKHLSGMGLEADDVIGCLSRMYDTENIIVTADKDCLQLINDHTKVLVPHKGVSESELVGEVELKNKYGIAPYQIVELKSLMGDPSDNIPGVKGVGEKTALKLLQDYVTLEGVYSHLNEIPGKLHEKLVESESVANLSHTLATIVTDKSLPFELKDFEYSYPFGAEVLQLFKQYQFNSLIKKNELFDENGVLSDNKPQENIKITTIDDLSTWDKIIDKLMESDIISLHIGDNAFSVYDGKSAYVLPIKKDLISPGFELDELIVGNKKLFESKVQKIVYDSKSLKHTLREFDIKLNNVAFDILLGRYILNSIGKVNVSFEEVMTENRCVSDVDAYNLYCIYLSYKSKLEEYKLNDIYYNMELPLTSVLFDMEIQGFKLDRDELNRQSDEYDKILKQITNDIYQLAGCEFNINSPKQLGEVLFDKLGIKSYNNKKKSTNAQVLDDIIDKHPIVPLIIRYRLLSKLYNTYIVPYKDMISEKTGKIYTVFNQFVTSTGRLSSSEPNLQNIPVRSEEGKNIRKIFVPTQDNGYIVSADYSQIELRLLAAFSGDEKLVNAFNNGIDIHALTASEIFGVKLEDVTPQLRRSAKVINFGIVYGMSDYGLSQDIGISVGEANSYIKSYFARYPKIEEYMNGNVAFCKENGYVTTLFGRRRYIPEINAPQYMMRQFGERAAKNMPLQGSASDIIKLAMVKVYDEFVRAGLKSKLILQVHDELIVDTANDELEKVCSILKNCMENIVKLPVKLSVNVAYGHNWYDAKD